ncbi:MAG: hypothetical protein PF482_05060, partial [Desulfobacteraceae bacterium]|nr:hypothetical protein [Desulfobacteraceae bacterium]
MLQHFYNNMSLSVFFQAKRWLHQGKFVLTAKPINHGPVDALTVGTVADPTDALTVGTVADPT